MPLIDTVVDQFRAQNIDCIVPADLFNDEGGLRHTSPQQWIELNGRTLADNAAEDRTMWCSNTLRIRTSHLRYALEHPDIKLIIALKGGYGSGEVAYELNRLHNTGQLDVKTGKAFIAYSDGTFLLNYLSQHLDITAIHGDMISGLAKEEPAENSTPSFNRFIDLLHGRGAVIAVEPLNEAAKCAASLSGKLRGGNLACLCSAIGTALQLETTDSILFLEDVNEKAYQITRNLLQLKEAGLLDKLKAIIFGTFTKGDPYVQMALTRALHQIINPSIPCFTTTQIGHNPDNQYIPLVNAHIRQGRLMIDSPLRLRER